MAFRPSTKLEKALHAIANGEKIKNPSTGLEKALAEVAEKGIGGGIAVDNSLFDNIRPTIYDLNKDNDNLNFAVITDLHFNKAGNKDSGIPEFKQFCQEKCIDFAICLGDLIDVYDNTKAETLATIDDVVSALNDINVPLFYAQGNHDKNAKKFKYNPTTGKRIIYDLTKSQATTPTSPTCDEDGRTGQRFVYDNAEKLSNAQLFMMMNKQNKDKIVRNDDEPSGNYFYKDFEEEKIRIIVLNPTHRIDESNAYYYFGQKQIKWLYEKALNFSDKSTDAQNWQIIIFTHMLMETHASERDRVLRALTGFKAGTDTTSANGGNLQQTDANGDYIYDDSGNTQDVTPVVSMACNGKYSTWNGGGMKIIAVIQGHNHTDSSNTIQGYNIVVLDRAFAKQEEVGTDKENCFSVFTVDKAGSTLHETRYGRGTSREFTYPID